ncbi:MAG: transposase [Thermoanaerobaculia bacterium]
MTRPLRFDFPGAHWHVYNRGVDYRSIFVDDDDRAFYEELLAKVCSEYRWSVLSYTQMTNHYHAFIQTREATLSRGMQILDGEFARRFNKRHGRVGALFQGRFNAQLVDSEAYLLELSRYIQLNAVRAGMVQRPEDWRWSSYRATVGTRSAPAWLDRDAILDRFDSRDRTRAAQLYRAYVDAGIGLERSPWEDLRDNLYLGSASFAARIELNAERGRKQSSKRDIGSALDTSTVAQAVELHFQIPLNPKRRSNDLPRLAFARLARSEALATYGAIADRLRLSVSGVRTLLDRAARAEASNPEFRDKIDLITRQLSEVHVNQDRSQNTCLTPETRV